MQHAILPYFLTPGVLRIPSESGVTLITTNESIGHTNQDDDHHLEEHDGQDLDDQSHDTESTQNDKHLEKDGLHQQQRQL